MTAETFLLILLIVFLIGAVPAWPHSRTWGYTPSGIMTFLLVVLIIWAVAGNRPFFKRSGGNIDSALRETGQDIKSAGRDAADSFKDAVQ